MINILYQEFPDHIEIDGRDFAVITDFREWIRFYELINSDLSDEQKAILMLDWYVDDVPEDIEKAIKGLGHFFASYDMYEHDEEEKTEAGASKAPAFSFSQDAEDIYTAFLQYYRIDLQEVEYMHWWKFKTLFAHLPEESEIRKKMYYRTLDASKIKNKEERARVRKIQKNIKLKVKMRPMDDFEIGDAFV